MFGYILPEKPELKVKEYELFRAYYCGVCKSIGKRYGQIQRLTLNYDSTFLALFLSSLSGEKLTVSKEGCIAHPFKKRHVIKYSEFIDYSSDMNILLAYYNMEDDWQDDRSFSGLAGRTLLARGFRKIRANYGGKCAIIKNRLDELAGLEKEKCGSMDKAAEPFAKLMEEVMAYGPLCTDPVIEKTLRWIGYNMGKWIYILDAYDDLLKDIGRKSYNPLLFQYKYDGTDPEKFKIGIRENVEFNLTYALGQIAKAYELMEFKGNASIVENIIYMGMLRKTEQILKVGSCENSEKPV